MNVFYNGFSQRLSIRTIKGKAQGHFKGVASNRKSNHVVDHVRIHIKWLAFHTYSSSLQKGNHKKSMLRFFIVKVFSWGSGMFLWTLFGKLV